MRYPRYLPHRGTLLLYSVAALTATLVGSPSYGAPGDLDPTFGAGGVASLEIGVHSYANAVAIQDDGKILAAGYVFTGSSGDMVVVRLDSSGALDPSFGTNGTVVLPAGRQSIAQAIALQPDDKIVVAGGVFVAPGVFDYDFRLARLLPSDGQLDPTFGTGGIVETPAAASQPGANSLALQPDGKILAGGEGKRDVTSTNRNRDFLVVRYLADGTLDTAFGDTGLGVVAMGRRYDLAKSLLLQPDGAIVATGYAAQGRSARVAVARLTGDGVLDESFARRGRQRLRLVTRLSYGEDAALLADGRIVTAGLSVDTSDLLSTASMALAQLTPAGDLDAGFGADGVASAAPDVLAYHHIRRIALQPDGKIVGVGAITRGTGADTTADVFLARFAADGSLDASFGTGGVVRSAFTIQDEAFAVALQSDGGIVVAGVSVVGTQSRLLVARYLP